MADPTPPTRQQNLASLLSTMDLNDGIFAFACDKYPAMGIPAPTQPAMKRKAEPITGEEGKHQRPILKQFKPRHHRRHSRREPISN